MKRKIEQRRKNLTTATEKKRIAEALNIVLQVAVFGDDGESEKQRANWEKSRRFTTPSAGPANSPQRQAGVGGCGPATTALSEVIAEAGSNTSRLIIELAVPEGGASHSNQNE